MLAPPLTKAMATTASSTISLARQSPLMMHPPDRGPVDQILMLQRTVGNQAVLRMLAEQRATSLPGNKGLRRREQGVDSSSQTDREATPGLSWDFSAIPIFSPDQATQTEPPAPLRARPLPGVLQPKLSIGRVNDPLEHEADRVADQVTRMPTPAVPLQPAPGLSRKITRSEGEGGLRKDSTELVKVTASAVPESVHEVLRSPGEPLDPSSRAYFEPRFGCDFSQVRVHADATAEQSARALHADAYTVAHNIVFGAGRLAASTPEGRRLLAHELTHVVQQSGANANRFGLSDRKPNVPGGLGRVMRAPVASALGKLPDSDKQALQFDTGVSTMKTENFFGLKGDIDLATNVDEDFDIQAPTIDALTDDKVKGTLWKGLRAYARSVFDLLPGKDGKAQSTRLNLVHVDNLDLTKWGGPNTSFRFTSRGKTTAGKINVKILIEALDQPAKPMADPSTQKATEALAAKYGLAHDPVFPDSVWNRILASLGKIPEALLMRIRDVTFDTSPQQEGPKKEAAEFSANFKDGKWLKRIILYKKLVTSKDREFAFTLAHEIGHAIDDAPKEGAAGPVAKEEKVHDDKKFLDAAKKDGGRAKAITDYAKTDDSEFFAECFGMYIQQPQTLQVLRPNIYSFFESYQAGAKTKP
jgi:Domain of unknown function (DUF4157)